MGLLQKATNEQAFLKAGILGFPGSGKTYTASMLAIGIAAALAEKKPVAFFDTETGSDFLIKRFEEEKIELLRLKSFAFVDLLQAGKEAEAGCSVLIVDSITHIWRQLCEDYAKKKGIRRLQFQHWSEIKQTWAAWTNFYLNARLHIFVCGRAGYEYDFEAQDDGKKELIKVGTKMKVEGEFGFEPSLLIEMERAERSAKPGAGWIHRAHVLKDRTDTINGRSFDFQRNQDGYQPGAYRVVFDAFNPVIQQLNIGGAHLGVDVTRNSEELFSGPDGAPEWKYKQQQKEIALDEIKELLIKHFPGQSAEAKKAKADALEAAAGTRSWVKIEALKAEDVLFLRNAFWLELEGKEYGSAEIEAVAPMVDDLPESFGEEVK